MNLLIGSLTIGLILSLLAMGVYISFRIFDFADITVDGSFPLGAAVAATLIVKGVHPIPATLAAAVMGCFAGAITGILHTRFRIHQLLSGILVMTALYSVNLHVMGRSNIPLMSAKTISTLVETLAIRMLGGAHVVNLIGWEVSVRDLSQIVFYLALIPALAVVLYFFLRTDLGTSMRATGNNPQMIRALGVNTGTMIVLGLALANGFVALSGAFLAQFQGFADVQMGIGMIVWGLASVIIGESLVRARHVGLTIAGAIIGAVLFRLLVAIALRFGLNPNDLKLITAIFVFAALVAPNALARLRALRGGSAHA